MFCYFLFTAYHVSKLNKNKFCVSRSRLGGDKKKVPVKGHTLCSKAEICWDILCQGSTKVPSGRPGQVDFEVGQVTFQGHLPEGQAVGQTLHQITF